MKHEPAPATGGVYAQRPPQPYVPAANIPDRLVVPPHTLLIITEEEMYDDLTRLVEPLHGYKERPWFTQHFYFCLPLTFGNQHGFIIRALYDFVVRWDGRPGLEGLHVYPLVPESECARQLVSSHFGSGIITIQNRFMFRTPQDVNLLVMAPPNYYVDGLSWLVAVVETDNLRRDFTFNIKVTRPHYDIYVPAGTPIGCVLPYPRSFLDQYTVERLTDPAVLAEARETMRQFGTARRDYDDNHPGLLYMRGVDVFGNAFPVHQKTLGTLE